jgi:hypothetical protein
MSGDSRVNFRAPAVIHCLFGHSGSTAGSEQGKWAEKA